MSDWSSFAENKELTNAWRDFLDEKKGNKRQRKKEEKKAREAAAAAAETAAPVETPSEEVPEAPPEADTPEGGGEEEKPAKPKPSAGDSVKGFAKGVGKGVGNIFAKIPFEKRPEDLLPTLRPTTGIGKFGVGATKGMRARRALRLARDLDVSRIAKAGAKGAAAAADQTPAAAKPASKAFQELTNDFLNPIAGGVATADDSRRNNAAKNLYKSLTPDEQKKIAAQVMKLKDPLPLKLRKILGITGVPSTTLEQVDLSLEDLIIEELLRVLNEEE